MAAAGAAVAVNYSSGKEGADRTVAAITGDGGKAIAIQADVSKAADVKHLLEETKNAFGSVDVLVNNAGVWHPPLVRPLTFESERTRSEAAYLD